MRAYEPGDAPANVPQTPPPVYDVPAWTPPPTYYEPPPVYQPVEVYQPTNPGWGGNPDYAVPGVPYEPVQANDMSGYGYDVPGTPENPSPPYTPPPVYEPPPSPYTGDVYQPTNPGWGGNPDYAVPGVPYEPVTANPVPPSWNHDVPGTPENPSPPYTPPDVTSPTTPYVPPVRTPGTPGTAGRWDIYDWMRDLPTDWEVVGAEGTGKMGVDNAENNFQRTLRQSFIDTGGDFSKIPEQFRQYIDQATIDQAKNNKYSLMAQNALTMRRTIRGQRARMAARGSEISGANTEMTRRQLESKELADINAYRSFEGGAFTGLGTVLDARLQALRGVQSAQSSAAARLAAAHPATWIEGTPELPGSDGYYDYGGGPAAGPTGAAPSISYTPSGTLTDPNAALNAARLRRLQELGY